VAERRVVRFVGFPATRAREEGHGLPMVDAHMLQGIAKVK
jgi:hypothetical protein